MKKIIVIILTTLIGMVGFTSCGTDKIERSYSLDKESLLQEVMEGVDADNVISATFARVMVSSILDEISNRLEFRKDGRVFITLSGEVYETNYTATKDSVFINGVSFKKEKNSLIAEDDEVTLIYLKD